MDETTVRFCVGYFGDGGLVPGLTQSHVATKMRVQEVPSGSMRAASVLKYTVRCPVCGRWYHASQFGVGDGETPPPKPGYEWIGERRMRKVIKRRENGNGEDTTLRREDQQAA